MKYSDRNHNRRIWRLGLLEAFGCHRLPPDV